MAKFFIIKQLLSQHLVNVYVHCTARNAGIRDFNIGVKLLKDEEKNFRLHC